MNQKVEFINTSADVIKALRTLSKKALRAGGSAVIKDIKLSVRTNTKNIINHIDKSVDIEKDTGQPYMNLGYLSWQAVKKKNKTPSRVSPHWLEFGVNSHQISPKGNYNMRDSSGNDYGRIVRHPGIKADHVLRNTVNDNIDKILEAESKWLVELNKTLDEVKGIVNQIENESDDDV